VDALLCGLDDPQKFIRVVSLHELRETAECQSGSACQDRVVSILGRRANAGTREERSEAIGWLMYDVYDAVAGPTATNNKIAATTLTLAADPDSSIRGQAIDNLDQMLSSQMRWHPDLKRLAIPNRKTVIRSLEAEKEIGGRRAGEAEHISSALGAKR
jgi:hypothetical protein